MLGPVFQLEWLHACRRGRHHLFRAAYCGLLCAEVVLFAVFWVLRGLGWVSPIAGAAPSPHQAVGELWVAFLQLIVAQHFVVLVLVTPALAAGTIADEKTRGTLGLLLTTDLTTQELIVGKWLGQAWQALLLAAPAVPLVTLLSLLCGIGPAALLSWLLATLLFGMALTTAALLASVWARKTASAVAAVYLLVGLGLGMVWLTTAWSPLDLFWSAEVFLQLGAPGIMPIFLLVGVALCGLLLAIAMWRLRPVYARQAAALAPRNAWTRWWRRPPIGANPVRWKECYVAELGALSFVKRWPRWLRLGAVGLLSFVGWMGIVVAAQHWTRAALLEISVLVCAAALMFLIAYVGGARASGVISGERERQTWDCLLATPLDPRQLVRGKIWGIIDGAKPYLLAYLAPALLVTFAAGLWSGLAVLFFWFLTWGLLYYQAANGVYWSSVSSSSWQSLLKCTATSAGSTLLRAFLAGLPASALVLSLISAFVPFLPLGYPPLVVGCTIALVAPTIVLLFGYAEELLQAAENSIARQERNGQ